MLRAPVLAPVLVFVLMLAGLFYVARYQRLPLPGRLAPKSPHTVRLDADQLADALAHAPWVSPGGAGPVLYKIGYRACPDCIAWDHTELPALLAGGVQTRILIYARRDLSTARERAVVAELACARAWPLYQRWTDDVEAAYYYRYGTPPAPEPDTARSACLERGRKVRDQVAHIVAKNGAAMQTPALFWQNKSGQWRFFMGNNARVNRLIRRELGVAQR